jgi:hypothetical protein
VVATVAVAVLIVQAMLRAPADTAFD